MRLVRLVGMMALGSFALFALLSLAVRYVLLPQIPAYRDNIAAALSKRIGAQVEIDAIATGWLGWNPKLVLDGVRLRERGASAPAIDLPHVELVASWTSILHADLRLRALAIDRPVLAAARDADGRLHVAGLEFEPGEAGSAPGLVPWVLRQREIVVRDATLTWTDELRAAPTISIENVDLRLTAERGRHRFGARGVPPPELASPFELRGEVADPPDGDWQRASGRTYLRVDYADVGAFGAWIPLPEALAAGQGALRAWCEFARGEATSVIADAELAGVRLALEPGRPAMALAHVGGRVEWSAGAGERRLVGRGIAFTTAGGASQPPADFTLVETRAASSPSGGTLEATRIDLASFAELSASLPLPARWSEAVAAAAPRGAFTEVRYRWEGDRDAPSRWSASASLAGVALSASARWPGIEGLAGSLRGDQDQGVLDLASHGVSMTLPRALGAPLRIDTIDGALRWRHDGDRLRVDVDDLALANPDAAGTLSGHWIENPGGPGIVDMAVTLSRGMLARLPDYVPAAIDERARAWLKRALVGGSIAAAKAVLQGDLRDFPFERPGSGTFTISADVKGATFDYADGWPRIEALDAALHLDRLHLVADAARASVLDARIGAMHADVPDVTHAVLALDCNASGDLAAFLRFVHASPVGGWTGQLFEPVRGSGNGRLELALSLPVHALEDTRVTGSFSLADASVDWPGVPPLREASADVAFERGGVTRGELAARVLDGPARATLERRDSVLHLAAAGNGDLGRLRETFTGVQAERIEGTSDWSVEASIAPHAFEWRARSSMRGASLALPAPFAKPREGEMPLTIERRMAGADRDRVTLTLGSAGRVMLQRVLAPEGATIDRALALVGSATERPGDAQRPGLWVRAQLPELDVDPWLALDLGGGTPGGGSRSESGLGLAGFDIASGRLTVSQRHFRDMTLSGRRDGDHWQVGVKGRNVEGDVAWYAATPEAPNGRARVRLARLALPYEDREEAPAATAQAAEATRAWPEIDLQAERLQWRGKEIGHLSLRAQPQGANWKISDLSLANDGGTITSQGLWHAGHDEHTEFSARFDIKDAGVFLGHFGYADEIRAAPTTGDGTFRWPGAPSDFDINALDGELALTAGRGQFLKADPGIARLLGVLSLQSLPRRITLDFHDVFSEGFAFDEASTGRVHIDNGVMRTDEFRIAGPAAKVTIRGEVDLVQETQALEVRVQPSIATGVSAGAAMLLVAANPLMAAVVGAGTLLAQKALKDPIEQLFSYDYRISGSWTEPLVQRVGAQPLGVAPGTAGKSP